MAVLQRFGAWGAIALIITGSAIKAAPTLLDLALPDHQIHVAATGSMTASGLGAGSLYVVEPVAAEEIEPGDMIRADSVFGFPIMHEATSAAALIDGCMSITMKGTSNPNDDPAPYCVENGAQRVVWGVERLGSGYLWLSDHWFHLPETVTQVSLSGALDRDFALGLPGVLPLLIVIAAFGFLARRAVPSDSAPSTLSTSDDEKENADGYSAGIEGPAPALGH